MRETDAEKSCNRNVNESIWYQDVLDFSKFGRCVCQICVKELPLFIKHSHISQVTRGKTSESWHLSGQLSANSLNGVLAPES